MVGFHRRDIEQRYFLERGQIIRYNTHEDAVCVDVLLLSHLCNQFTLELICQPYSCI
jgi:hypothetical protein